MSTLQDLTAQLVEQPTWDTHDINGFAHFLHMRRKDVKFYKVTDVATGDTFVILKWPHQVPGLTIIQ